MIKSKTNPSYEFTIYTHARQHTEEVAAAASSLFTTLANRNQMGGKITADQIHLFLSGGGAPLFDSKDKEKTTQYADWIAGAISCQKSPCGKHVIGPLFELAEVDSIKQTLAVSLNKELVKQYKSDTERRKASHAPTFFASMQ